MPKAKATPSKPAAADREATKKKAPAKATARAKKPAAAKARTAKKAPATVKRKTTATRAAKPRATAAKKPATKAVRAKKPAAPKAKKAAATTAPVLAEKVVETKVARRKAPGRSVTETAAMPGAAPEPVAAKPQAVKPAETRAAGVKKVARATESTAKAPKSSVPASRPQQPKPVVKALRRTTTRPQTVNVPLTAIDTSLAAQVAASMVANHLAQPAGDTLPLAAPQRPVSKPVPDSILGKRETSTFRHMKERVANPPSHQLDSVLGVLPRKKTHLPVTGTGFVPGQTIDKNYGLEVRPVNPLRRKAG